MGHHVVYKEVYEILYKICVTDSLHSNALNLARFTVFFEIPVHFPYSLFFLDSMPASFQNSGEIFVPELHTGRDRV